MKMHGKQHKQGGFLSLETLGVLAIIMVAIVLAVGVVSMMFSKSSINDEISNVQHMATQSKGLLKTQGEYPFSSAAKMTGALVQFGGVPGNITVNGEKSSGNATLANSWGGQVLVSPEKVQGSPNNVGFSITYKSVPQEACATMATKLSGSALINEVKISGTVNVGRVTAEQAGTQCKADNGSVGLNELVFKSNS
ncbi:prepilin [Pseudomonas protegens]|uniref:Prepilin n=1 Tax=Pseudomonas protegens TaxID=380021 RepID=A0A2T6GBF9_9PSED|nr:type 4 pilus major pilin [Pseudomonas protegens]PUA41485.1 prepilin [Pseudomonas protegens]